MDLNDLYRNLSFGPLSNLAMAGSGDGTITDRRKPMIVGFANEALIRLYTRFNMLQKDVLIEMVPHITNYHFLKRFAQSSKENLEPYRYIIDLPLEPFEEDMVKILTVFDSFGNEKPLNDDARSDSLYTPQDKILQVPSPVPGQSLSVLYQAKHPVLCVDCPDTEIILPETLYPALYAYIAYQVFDGLGTEGSLVKANNNLAKYEALCTEVEDRDALNTSISNTNVRFNKNGWI